jgi:ABC-type amino acid transport substrate-binding protein
MRLRSHTCGYRVARHDRRTKSAAAAGLTAGLGLVDCDAPAMVAAAATARKRRRRGGRRLLLSANSFLPFFQSDSVRSISILWTRVWD